MRSHLSTTTLIAKLAIAASILAGIVAIAPNMTHDMVVQASSGSATTTSVTANMTHDM
jgi:hypothetical protein